MREILRGRVCSGQNDASRWLDLYNAAYRRKTGMNIYPGSLNLLLEHKFDWRAIRYEPLIIWFGREEMGGERDILLLPCVLANLGNRRAFLWTTTNLDWQDAEIIEVITDVGLRDEYNLIDGDLVEVELAARQNPDNALT
jgi:CTP-dependent riboflavin kinase